MKLFSGKNKYYSLAAIIFLILIASGTIGYIRTRNSQNSNTSTEKIKEVTTAIAKEYKSNDVAISAVGEIEALEQVEIKSQLSAEVKKTYVKIGDLVKKGQLLIELDHSSADAQLSQAKASIDRAENAKAQKVAGATSEQIEQAYRAVEQARAALEQTKTSNESTIKNLTTAVELAKTSLNNTGNSTEQAIKNAYTNLRLSIKNNLPNIWSSLTYVGNILGKEPGDVNSNFSYDTLLGASNPVTKTESTRLLYEANNLYNQANAKFLKTNDASLNQEIDESADLTYQALSKTKEALNSTRQMLDFTVSGNELTETTIAAFKTQIDAYLSSIGGSLSAIENGRQAAANALLSESSSADVNTLNYEKALQDLEQGQKQTAASQKSAESALAIQEASYKILTASPRDIDLAGLQASINETRAAYSLIAVNRDKALIRAPFDGTISAVAVKNNDLANMGQSLVSLVNTKGLQLTAYISEKDRRSINEGDKALIENSINGIVSRISPSLDPITKKVEVIIAVSDDKPNLTIGQSAEAIISSPSLSGQDNSYLLPLKTVTITQNEVYLFTLDGDIAKKRPITIGKIDGAIIEVTGGLTDTDIIITEGNRSLKEGDVVKIKS